MIFLPTDLNLPEDALDQITQRLANAARPDPIGDSIAAQMQKVNDYTLRYEMADDRLKRLTRALVLWDVHTRMGSVPSNIDKDYDEAMKELRDIRDGKFPDLQLKDSPAPDQATAQGAWGSNTKII